MENNDIKKEINDIKKLVSEQVDESEKLKENVKVAVNSFIRLETLYKIKCKELEMAKEQLAQSRKETAREILDTIKFLVEERNGADIEDLSVDGTILEEVLDELAKQYGVEVEE